MFGGLSVVLRGENKEQELVEGIEKELKDAGIYLEQGTEKNYRLS